MQSKTIDKDGRSMGISENMGIIFDMDGTLLDSERLVLKCWEEVGESQGYTDIGEMVISCMGLNKDATRKKMQLRYGEDFPYDKLLFKVREMFMEMSNGDFLPLKPGVMETLEFFAGKNVKMSVATSTSTRVATEELENRDIASYFENIVGGDMVSSSKPAPDIYLLACKLQNVKPSISFAIEDSHNGVRSASSAGLRTIMVPDMAPATEEMSKLAETILPTMIDARNYIARVWEL